MKTTLATCDSSIHEEGLTEAQLELILDHLEEAGKWQVGHA